MPEQKQITPAFRDYPEETLCPSCGKFVGAYVRCPYCGTKRGRRISIRFFRTFSIVMALGGVFLIWFVARGIKAPLVKIENIQPTNAFAYVRVEGEVTGSRVGPEGGVRFWVDDGTGSLMVRAYADIGKMLWEMDRVPAPGDMVSAEGTLNLRENFVMMIVNIPEKITIERPETEVVAIANIDEDYIGNKIAVEGRIVGERTFRNGSSITVSDGTGTLDVVIWDSNRKIFGEREALLEIGRSVKISGQVDSHRDRLQIKLDFPRDIEALEHDVEVPESILDRIPGEAKGFRKTAIGDVNRARLNKFVAVSGEVSDLRTFSRGKKFHLTDATGSCEVVVWDTLYSRIPAAQNLIEEGALLNVRGLVDEYRGQLQVVPKSPGHIERAEIE